MSEFLLLLKMEYRKNLSFGFLLILIFFLLVFSIFLSNPVLIPVIIFIMTSTLYLSDNRNGFLQFINALPVKKSSVVKARYCHAISISVGACLTPLVGVLFGIENSYTEIFPMTLFMISFYTAFNMPFIMVNHKYANLFCALGYIVLLVSMGAFVEILGIFGFGAITYIQNLNVVSSVLLSIIVWLISYIISQLTFKNLYIQEEDKI